MITRAHDDPESGVDALVTAIAPRLRASAVRRRDVVLVAGPRLAGVSGVAAALGDRLSDRVVVETPDLAAGEAPTAVVFVVSAAAALTDSDCALLDAAAAHTDVVVGAVAKIDLHRHWPEMLRSARDGAAAHASRYRDVPWIGVAALPDRGEPRVDDLVAEVRKQLGGIDVQRRNRLRAWECRLQADARRYQLDAEAVGRRARVALLQDQRDTALRQRRLLKSERTIALRSRIAQARVQLSSFARNRCGSVRAELQEDAAGMTRRRLPEFEDYVRSRVDEVVCEVADGTTEHLADVAHELGLEGGRLPTAAPLPEVEATKPALRPRRLETQLMLLLGAGFGLGVALTLSRLLARLVPPELTTAGAVVCVPVGVAVTAWVVATRGLLRDRAVLDRWVTEVIGRLRSTVEELVALRVLSAESAFSAELAERNEDDGSQVADRVAVLDGELREHAVVTARAAALRDREMPALQRALAVVRKELGGREATLSATVWVS